MKIELPALVNSVLAKKKKRQHTLLFSLKKGTLFLGKGHLSAREQTVLRTEGPKVTSWSPQFKTLKTFLLQTWRAIARVHGPRVWLGIRQFSCAFSWFPTTHTHFISALWHIPLALQQRCGNTAGLRSPEKLWHVNKTLMTELAKQRQTNSDLGGPLFRRFSSVFAECILASATSRGLLLHSVASAGLSVANTLLVLCEQLKVHLQRVFKNWLRYVSLY